MRGRRWAAVLIAAVVAATASGCGALPFGAGPDDAETASAEPTPSEQSPTATATTGSTPTAEPTTAPTPTPTPTPSATARRTPAGTATPVPPPSTPTPTPEPTVDGYESVAAAIAAWVAQQGRDFAGACDSATLENDIGKICYSISEDRGSSVVAIIGDTFSEYDRFLLVESGPGGWRVADVAAMPGPDEEPSGPPF